MSEKMSVASSSEDPDSAKTRRLRKAVKLVATLKEKYRFEKEVSSELARRNETLRAEADAERWKFEHLMACFLEIDEIAFSCIDSDVSDMIIIILYVPHASDKDMDIVAPTRFDLLT